MSNQQTEDDSPRPFYFNVVEECDKEFVLEISKEDYERDFAAGFDEDDMLRPGRHVFHRVSPERVAKWSSEPREITVYVKLPLDYEVHKHFAQRAAEANAESTEKFISDALRALKEAEIKRDAESPPTSEFEKLIDNERFIAAVAERVEKRIRT